MQLQILYLMRGEETRGGDETHGDSFSYLREWCVLIFAPLCEVVLPLSIQYMPFSLHLHLTLVVPSLRKYTETIIVNTSNRLHVAYCIFFLFLLLF